MKRLLKVTREEAGGILLLYLYYALSPQVSKTLTIDEESSLAIDLDAHGDVVGIELIAPKAADFALLAQIAEERDLSLEGLFSESGAVEAFETP